MVHLLLKLLLAGAAGGAAGYCLAKRGQRCEKCAACRDKLPEKPKVVSQTTAESKKETEKIGFDK